MIRLKRIALIGNSLPRRCGIATFTSDLRQAIASVDPTAETTIVAMNDRGRRYDYPETVGFQIADDDQDDFAAAAAFLNDGNFGVVSLQHEFGIFGGEAGRYVIPLLTSLKVPLVTTLHTVLAAPSPVQRTVLGHITDASAKVVVMAEKGRQLLRDVYGVPDSRIEVIPHGIPLHPFVDADIPKAKLGFAGRQVILTFGLLSPAKGIEVMIDAMPGILSTSPQAVYVVLGATHPNLVRSEGEVYRDSLVARAESLGVAEHVVFLDRFVDQATLLRFIAMCDVYVTPYLNESQMTSGTLAYSYGLGKPVVSTPYWHARELLADQRGVLVPFGDSTALGEAIAGLLGDESRRLAMARRAFVGSRSMTWPRVAERYLDLFATAARTHRPRQQPQRAAAREAPPIRLAHLLAMTDDTGLFQHAIHSIPDRSHGYCIDDNARALLLGCALNTAGGPSLPDVVTTRLASFIEHGWNPDLGRFRNFMGFDRTWLEPQGSEDSHGRTLWALGICARHDSVASRRRWATALFAKALGPATTFSSPRAWAFTLLGLDAYCAVAPQDQAAFSARNDLAERLMTILAAVETPGWHWFEDGLSYDNPRLCQALIVAGGALGSARMVAAGLRTLRWLMARQRGVGGVFRPVGSDSFGDLRKPPRDFDQQPLEAAATISACLAAFRAAPDRRWKDDALRAFAWFRGENDLGVALVDEETGSCRDGLHPDRANENRGGESVVSYLLALSEIRALTDADARREPLHAVVA